MFSDPNPWWGISQSGIAATAGLGGVFAGSWLTNRHLKAERRNARVKQQLQEFYSPLLGMRAEIKAKSEVRVKLSAAGNAEWQNLFIGITDPMVKKQIQDAHWPQFEKLIERNDAEQRKEIIPIYGKMLGHFSANMWLAEPSTQTYYGALVEFVELWDRHLEGSLPSKVAQAINPQEKDLYPFYDDLQKNFDRLTAELRK